MTILAMGQKTLVTLSSIKVSEYWVFQLLNYLKTSTFSAYEILNQMFSPTLKILDTANPVKWYLRNGFWHRSSSLNSFLARGAAWLVLHEFCTSIIFSTAFADPAPDFCTSQFFGKFYLNYHSHKELLRDFLLTWQTGLELTFIPGHLQVTCIVLSLPALIFILRVGIKFCNLYHAIKTCYKNDRR